MYRICDDSSDSGDSSERCDISDINYSINSSDSSDSGESSAGEVKVKQYHTRHKQKILSKEKFSPTQRSKWTRIQKQTN